MHITVSARSLRREYSRGGQLWTAIVTQRMGAWIAVAALRYGWSPNSLSVANAAVASLATAGALAAGTGSWLAALVGLVGWQLAYGLDCADGQVARATRTSSPGGALVDLAGDFVAHTAVLIAVLDRAPVSSAAAVLLTAGWLSPVFWFGLQQVRVASTSARTGGQSRRVLRRVLATPLDWGLHVLVLPLTFLGAPTLTRVTVVVITVVEAAFVLLSMAGTAREARA